ncbi:S-layer protein, partial [Candidatus Woesearchaeota archaeon]
MRKAIKKIVALGVGTTMLGATMFGALAANLSDWPQPFVTDGLADFVIVLGEFAAVSDVIGAIDIATSLQTESVTETVVGGGSTVTAVGDAVQIISGSDLLELNEPISDIKKVLTENDMDMLKSGTVTTDEGTTKYRQYLRFNDSSVTITPPRVVYDSNGARDAEVGDFLYLE